MAAPSMGERGVARPPRSFLRSEDDARRYERLGMLYMLGIYVALGASMAGRVSIWVVLPIIMVCYVRGALLTHELMHVRRPERVPWVLRMMMLLETPFGLGYREHQSIHLRHHQCAATAADPEFFQIKGGSMRAFLAAMVGSELAIMKWVLAHGISSSLRREASIRAIVMLTLVAIDPTVFLRYWVVLRLTIGFSNFMFHHMLHYRHGEYGTFTLRLPWPIDAMLRSVLGSSMAAVLCEHDAHHAWCNVKPERLRGLLRSFPKAPFSSEVRP